jgi:hypothetical protein
MDRLTARRRSDAAIERLLGAPSYHWHVHGIGNVGLTYVPYGLSFVGGWPDGGDSMVAYQVMIDDPGYDEVGDLVPLRSLSHGDAVALQRQGRAAVAKELLSQRERIDQALASGKLSPDGRFVVNHLNLGGLGNTEEIVIGEHDHAERRYHAPYFTEEKNYRWLNEQTILFEDADQELLHRRRCDWSGNPGCQDTVTSRRPSPIRRPSWTSASPTRTNFGTGPRTDRHTRCRSGNSDSASR